jgi:hypothetical protein
VPLGEHDLAVLDQGGDDRPLLPAVDEAARALLALTNRDRIAASNRAFRHYRRSVEVIPDTDLGVTEPAGAWKHLRTEGVSGARYDEGDGAVYVRVV